MEIWHYLVVSLSVLLASGLTFFSGFGLGTIMLPVFSLFMPLHLAVVATAIVHFANNVFKFALVCKSIHFPVLLRFGIPALLSAIFGGYILTTISTMNGTFEYTFLDHTLQMSWLKIIIGILMIFFAWFDLSPRFSNLTFHKKYLPFGGILSGFFGGLSGHQGAFRAVFLSKSEMTKDQFVATSNSLSLVVDIGRLIVYSAGIVFLGELFQTDLKGVEIDLRNIIIFAIVCAFLGTIIGKQLVRKVTFKNVQKVVGVLLIFMGLLLILGIL